MLQRSIFLGGKSQSRDRMRLKWARILSGGEEHEELYEAREKAKGALQRKKVNKSFEALTRRQGCRWKST